jgi:hypothetical protein
VQYLVQVRRAQRALAEAFEGAGGQLDFEGVLTALMSAGFGYLNDPPCPE